MHLFGFQYKVAVSTRPESSIGTDEAWELATNALIQAIREGKMDVWTDDFQKLTGQQPMTVLYMFQHSDQFQVGERHSKDN